MSTRSPNSPRPDRDRGRSKDRPFDSVRLSQARRAAGRYRLVLVQEDEDYLALSAEFPGVIVRGADAGECERKAREALAVVIATLLEAGRPVPGPQPERRSQLNLRLAAEERSLIENAARLTGAGSVSEYVRIAALAKARQDMADTD
jgi:predicted RNase H-like HicB family nuclease